MCKFGRFLLHPVQRTYLPLPVRIPARGLYNRTYQRHEGQSFGITIALFYYSHYEGSVQAPWEWSKTETCGNDNFVYFHVNLNFPEFKKSVFVGEWTIYKVWESRKLIPRAQVCSRNENFFAVMINFTLSMVHVRWKGIYCVTFPTIFMKLDSVYWKGRLRVMKTPGIKFGFRAPEYSSLDCRRFRFIDILWP
jgi:hypothetical protein